MGIPSGMLNTYTERRENNGAVGFLPVNLLQNKNSNQNKHSKQSSHDAIRNGPVSTCQMNGWNSYSLSNSGRIESGKISFSLCSYHCLVIRMTDRINIGNDNPFFTHISQHSDLPNGTGLVPTTVKSIAL